MSTLKNVSLKPSPLKFFNETELPSYKNTKISLKSLLLGSLRKILKFPYWVHIEPNWFFDRCPGVEEKVRCMYQGVIGIKPNFWRFLPK